MLKHLVLVLCATLVAGQGRGLVRGDPQACAQRTKQASAFRNGHHYFFSWKHPPTATKTFDWLDARNICRKHCQDAVSLETVAEANFIKKAIEKGNVKSVWTSGRKCNFDGCDRKDLKPTNINGWFWSGTQVRFPATNSRKPLTAFWSKTGASGVRQPDNREHKRTGHEEACMAILKNAYTNDGVAWHDVACHHKKAWICEDSDELLAYARSTNPKLKIP